MPKNIYANVSEWAVVNAYHMHYLNYIPIHLRGHNVTGQRVARFLKF